MITRAAVALTTLTLLLAACGPGGGGPTTRGRAPGQSCAKTSDCQGGLTCDPSSKTCDYERCEDAPDPAAFCADALSLPADKVRCSEGACEQLLGQVGDPCAQDDTCRFGLICEGATCVDTCTSSASCRAEGTACLPRPDGSGTRDASFCQPSPGCAASADPGAFCADMLGVAPEETICQDDGACLYKKYGEGELCARDGQCDSGLVCEDDACTPSCTEGDSCGPLSDDVCLPRTSGRDGSVCRQPSCAEVEDGDQLCVAEYGPGWVCDRLSRTCEPSMVEPSGVFGILIEDTSDGDACTAQTYGLDAPGADLTHVILRDAEGFVRAYGLLILVDAGGEANDHLSATTIDGEAPALDAMSCPVSVDGARFRQDNVLSLGCGGHAAIVFLDEDSAPIQLEGGDLVEVGEFGATCASAEEPDHGDRYRLRLCRDEEALFSQDPDGCDIIAADALSGITTTTIDLAALGLTPE